MQATANSRSVSRNNRISVSELMEIWILIRLMVAELTIVIRRWPAVMLAVSRTPSAIGRISRLTVSIKIMNGISGVGEPSGRRWASVIDGLFFKPVMMVASHRGIAIAMFIDSWEVDVKVYGSRLSRLNNRIIRIRLVSRWDHFCPFKVSWFVMFSINVFRNKMVAVVMRFPRSLGLW